MRLLLCSAPVCLSRLGFVVCRLTTAFHFGITYDRDAGHYERINYRLVARKHPAFAGSYAFDFDTTQTGEVKTRPLLLTPPSFVCLGEETSNHNPVLELLRANRYAPSLIR